MRTLTMVTSAAVPLYFQGEDEEDVGDDDDEDDEDDDDDNDEKPRRGLEPRRSSSRHTETVKSVTGSWKCANSSRDEPLFAQWQPEAYVTKRGGGKTHNTPKSSEHTETRLQLSIWIERETCMSSKTFPNTRSVLSRVTHRQQLLRSILQSH